MGKSIRISICIRPVRRLGGLGGRTEEDKEDVGASLEDGTNFDSCVTDDDADDQRRVHRRRPHPPNMSISGFLFVYLLGGITFLPLLGSLNGRFLAFFSTRCHSAFSSVPSSATPLASNPPE